MATPLAPTGKYAGCKHWAAVVRCAKLRPHLRTLAENYERTGHPACLNAIMDNADANLWLTYHTGAETTPEGRPVIAQGAAGESVRVWRRVECHGLAPSVGERAQIVPLLVGGPDGQPAGVFSQEPVDARIVEVGAAWTDQPQSRFGCHVLYEFVRPPGARDLEFC